MSDENYYECTLEKEGFLGTFYPGTQYPDSGIILVGGSGEKRELVEERGKTLAQEGFSVLTVGYYLWKPLSKDTVRIPVDYVERAVQWLKNACPVEICPICQRRFVHGGRTPPMDGML